MSSLTNDEKKELIGQVKQQVALDNAKELLTMMTEKCFKKCIGKPGTKLNTVEQDCISMCMDRFIESWNLISRTYGTRLRNELSQKENLSAELQTE